MYDGSELREIMHGHEFLSHPFAIGIFGNFMYWSDWRTNSLVMVGNRMRRHCYHTAVTFISIIIFIIFFISSFHPRLFIIILFVTASSIFIIIVCVMILNIILSS